MTSIPYVVERGRSLYFRRSVPVEFRHRIERSELVRSLGTGDLRIARGRAFRLYSLSEHIFNAARDPAAMLTKAQLSRLVQAFYDHVLEQENDLRLGYPPSQFMPQPLPEELSRKRAEYFMLGRRKRPWPRTVWRTQPSFPKPCFDPRV